jgi:GAF domain-containing protein
VTVPGFDDTLLALLAAESAELGETVPDFVGRAVALRLVQSMAARRDPQYTETIDRLVGAGLLPADPSEPHRRSVIDDPERLRILYNTGLLDKAPGETLRRTVGLAAEALSVPSAAICLVDRTRQYLACGVGLPEGIAESHTLSLDQSIAKYIVASGRPLVIEDIRADPTLRHHPAVSAGAVASYLGVPLTNSGGFTVGALCAWDRRPRTWSDGHVMMLRDLADVLTLQIFR